MSKPSEVPAWLRDVPLPSPDEEPAPENWGREFPHPGDLSPDELARLMEGPGFSTSTVLLSAPQAFLDPIWWSLGEAAVFFEANETNDDPDSSTLFSGLKSLERKLRSWQLKAYGSIDTAPVTAIAVEVWTEFEMVPYNINSKGDGAVSYDVLIRSLTSYRASALSNHAFPSGATVPTS